MVRTRTMPRPEWSVYWPEIIKYYSGIDVKGKILFYVGCDYGTSPMYFLRRGAAFVFGFSLDKQIFRSDWYRHHVNMPPEDIMHLPLSGSEILKIDAEGMEWDFQPLWINKFADWIIACHKPVRNPTLHAWIEENGERIMESDGQEFAIYRKRA
ncbi:MAG: hypothetical protein QXP70_01910 [Methanomassiliicoccales archaeon]